MIGKMVISENVKQTKKLAGDFAKHCQKLGFGQNALVIAMNGDLGSGKTAFVQGFAKALGIKERIVSPTFVILKNYPLRITNYKYLIHIDAYRIEKTKELLNLGWKDIIKDPQNIIIVEWAENIKKILPPKYVKIEIEHKDKNKRIIKFD